MRWNILEDEYEMHYITLKDEFVMAFTHTHIHTDIDSNNENNKAMPILNLTISIPIILLSSRGNTFHLNIEYVKHYNSMLN